MVTVGVVYLLLNAGLIFEITWSIVWPTLLIAMGLSCFGKRHGWGMWKDKGCGSNMCGGCGSSEEHKCEGSTCKVCSK